jgi:hypothetical protein
MLKLKAFLFADDKTLLARNANLNLFHEVYVEFCKVVYYFRAHRLVLHPDKMTLVLFSNSNIDTSTFNIYIDNNNYDVNYDLNLKSSIQCVNNLEYARVKFARVLIDYNLSFRFPIENISSKLSNALFHLRSAKKIFSQKALTSLYYSLVHSHLIYAIQIWSCTAPSNLKELVKKTKTSNPSYPQCSLYCSHRKSL